MNYLTKVDDARAWVRAGRVFKQLEVYTRGGRYFVPHSGGFVRIEAAWGGYWPTSHPNVTIYEVDGITL